jgi:hypothetical protein
MPGALGSFLVLPGLLPREPGGDSARRARIEIALLEGTSPKRRERPASSADPVTFDHEVDELAAPVEARHRLSLPGDRRQLSALSKLNTGPANATSFGQRHRAEVAAVVLLGVVVESDRFDSGHRSSASRTAERHQPRPN